MAEQVQTDAADQSQENGATSEQGTQGGAAGQQGAQGAQRVEGKDYFEPFQDQQRRAEKAEGELKSYKQQLIDAGILDKDGKPKKPTAPAQASGQQQASSSSASNDDVVRARLEARGVLEEDEQDAVMQAANVFGITPVQALGNEFVQAKLKGIRDQKATSAATPAPSRGGGTSNNISKLADKALETGELPTDPTLKKQVKEEMRRRK